MVVLCIVGVAFYSALIEVGQHLLGSTEGLGWNVGDTLCGAVGGALAVADRLREHFVRSRRLHAPGVK